jgi:cell division protein ZapA
MVTAGTEAFDKGLEESSEGPNVYKIITYQMQELIPINIVIGDRTYRVRIDAADEEKVRKLMKLINDRILDFKDKFAGKDMQDYIAMVMLWFVTEQEQSLLQADQATLTAGLDEIERMLDQQLGQS